MADLNIKNLKSIVESGDIERLFNGRQLTGINEEHVAKEMRTEGLTPSSTAPQGKSFSDILKDSVEKVNEYQSQADTAIKELVAGRNKNIHETMLTIERADTSLKLMMQVRNKILDAYKEIIRMQV